MALYRADGEPVRVKDVEGFARGDGALALMDQWIEYGFVVEVPGMWRSFAATPQLLEGFAKGFAFRANA